MMKFDTTLPSLGCILGPKVLNILATRTSTSPIHHITSHQVIKPMDEGGGWREEMISCDLSQSGSSGGRLWLEVMEDIKKLMVHPPPPPPPQQPPLYSISLLLLLLLPPHLVTDKHTSWSPPPSCLHHNKLGDQ